ncbi:IPExxxVDY family protein [Halpernia sp.]|uniref:IPExxxVDY family protein n=1 Tax=Halpernia sp. TaxID=2782209 RepID=UPI003A925A9C
MKTKKLFLDEEEEETTNLGLLRLSQELPAHELFYKINKLNAFKFSRIKDLIIYGEFYQYNFPRFEAYHHLSKNCIQILSNKSAISHKIKEEKELFNFEEETSYLFSELQDVDYLIKTSDLIDEFSLILMPENFVFNIQTFPLSSIDERYELIQYYE